MKKLRLALDALRSSLWFIPAILVAASVTLAVVLTEFDLLNRGALEEAWPRLFGAGAEGSRGLLSAIAGSMITVAGVTFSITTVTLALAASQYSSRILRSFMRDRANQAVLGVFVGVFAYCLVVLRTIHSGPAQVFVPALAVFVALLLALVAIGFFIFFIHHIAASIQATSIITSVARETSVAIDRLYAPLGHGGAGEPVEVGSDDRPRDWIAVPSLTTGYVQAVECGALIELARERGRVIRMDRGVGEFVVADCPLASVAGSSLDERDIRRLNRAYAVGRDRTVQQDPAYGIRQIVDIALRALSPAMNDTTTALICVDHLGAILTRLAARRIAAPLHTDEGALRLIERGTSFRSLLGEALDQIRESAQSNVAVLVRLLEALALVRERLSDPDRLLAVQEQADRVTETAHRSVPSAEGRARIHATRGHDLGALTSYIGVRRRRTPMYWWHRRE